MLQTVSNYISRHKLLDKSKLHLVALSGGADSVCLLLMLKELGYALHAVHCNFHLRGEESDRDEKFCVSLCRELGIKLHLTQFDTKIYAELHKVSIEMAARELRYNYFEQLRQAIDAEDIIVAHHKDDNVETFLMNIIRGTGIHGLEAIKPRNGKVIRPLLCLSRREIEDFLLLRKQPYVTDSSNLLDDVVRNKVRLNLLPMLESINPAVRESIIKTISHVSEAVKIVDSATEEQASVVMKEEGGMTYICKERLLSLPSPEHILYAIMSRFGFSSAQVEQVFGSLSAPPGRLWASSTHEIATDRDALVIAAKEQKDNPLRIPETGTYIYNVRARLTCSINEKAKEFVPSRERYFVTLDADKVRFPLVVRTVADGDRFAPFGMKGTKLVSDFLTDKKRNIFQRKKQLLVQDATGEIVWLVGERTSQRAACGADTIKILSLRYIYDEE